MIQLFTSSHRAFIKAILILIVLVELAQHQLYAAAQDDSDYEAAPADSPMRSHPRKHIADDKIKVSKTVAIIVVSLIGTFFITGCVSVLLAKNCIRRELALESHGAASHRQRRRLFRRPVSSGGLDRRIIGTFPTLVYSEVKKDGISPECAVCLSEFESTETLRMLPKCCHVFHCNCIAVWLSTHITCPVCRANLAHKPDPVGVSDSIEDFRLNHLPPRERIGEASEV